MPPAALEVAPPQQGAAARNRDRLRRAGVSAIRLTGPDGAGKTSLIEATLRRINDPSRVAVIVAHPAAAHDVQRLDGLAGRVIAVETARLTPNQIQQALNEIDLAACDLILIEGETHGNAPSEEELGEAASLAVLSVPGGDDKVSDFAPAVARSPVVLLTQSDLMPHVGFSRALFAADLERVNGQAQLMAVSTTTGETLDQWIEWLEMRRLEARFRRGQSDSEELPAEWWFG
jgi:hydrogenase nickel incorporation protein HypB